MSTTEFIGIAIAFLIAAVGAARWLIGHYFEQRKELEALKESAVQKSIHGLEALVKLLEHEIEVLGKRVDQSEKSMIRAVAKIEAFEKSFEAVGAIVQQVADFIEKVPEKSEIRRLGKDLYILRAKAKAEGE